MSATAPNEPPGGGTPHRGAWVRPLEIGGLLAATVLIVFGVAAIVMGLNGRSTVHDNLEREKIEGSPDMTASAIAKEAKDAGLPESTPLPDCDVAGETVDDGDTARCFAQYMHVHALEATGGFTYSQMGQFEAKPGTPKSQLAEGGGTSNEKFAVVDPETGGPKSNGARQVWINETSLATALNTSYMAERISLFGIVVGIALLLAGIGFATLVLTGAVRRSRT
jgi:hypothetical protein